MLHVICLWFIGIWCLIWNLFLCALQTGDKREVIHFHYTTWPDFGVPTSPTAFLNFLKVVREAGALEADVGPAVIHCSAGIGRSGTFCVVDSCLVLVSDELLPLDIVLIWYRKLRAWKTRSKTKSCFTETSQREWCHLQQMVLCERQV